MAEMTPRERWLAIFNRQEVDRVPTDYWGTTEVTGRLLKEMACGSEEELWRKLRIDRPRHFWPRYLKQREDGADMWGVRFEMTSYGTGAYEEAVHSPLAK